MKRILAVTLCGLILAGCGGNGSSESVTPASGGILQASWGEGRDSVRSKFNSLEGVRLALDSADLVYVGGSYEGYPVGTWILSFQEQGGFWSGRIVFAQDSAEGATLATGLETMLTGKYGAPAEPMRWIVRSQDGVVLSTIALVAAEGRPVELHIENPAVMSVSVEPVSQTPVVE